MSRWILNDKQQLKRANICHKIHSQLNKTPTTIVVIWIKETIFSVILIDNRALHKLFQWEYACRYLNNKIIEFSLIIYAWCSLQSSFNCSNVQYGFAKIHLSRSLHVNLIFTMAEYYS